MEYLSCFRGVIRNYVPKFVGPSDFIRESKEWRAESQNWKVIGNETVSVVKTVTKDGTVRDFVTFLGRVTKDGAIIDRVNNNLAKILDNGSVIDRGIQLATQIRNDGTIYDRARHAMFRTMLMIIILWLFWELSWHLRQCQLRRICLPRRRRRRRPRRCRLWRVRRRSGGSRGGSGGGSGEKGTSSCISLLKALCCWVSCAAGCALGHVVDVCGSSKKNYTTCIGLKCLLCDDGAGGPYANPPAEI